MEKNSTPDHGEGLSRATTVTISYFGGPLLEPAGPAPRRSTIERIRQFARAAYIDPALPEMAIIMN
ncbi:MAG: hypothetical protein HDT06_00275 [Bacteroidales bacterium]|nr:hypothetical protein [Bacteroidales bacterium]MBD5218618.1 hypothetical protein [Bacteroidales bacterium]